MGLEHLVMRYGLLAVLLGSAVEGDFTLILAGVCAHLGYFPFPLAVAAGAVGSFAGDLAWYTLGRLRGPRFRAGRFYQRVGHRIEALARAAWDRRSSSPRGSSTAPRRRAWCSGVSMAVACPSSCWWTGIRALRAGLTSWPCVHRPGRPPLATAPLFCSGRCAAGAVLAVGALVVGCGGGLPHQLGGEERAPRRRSRLTATGVARSRPPAGAHRPPSVARVDRARTPR